MQNLRADAGAVAATVLHEVRATTPERLTMTNDELLAAWNSKQPAAIRAEPKEQQR